MSDVNLTNEEWDDLFEDIENEVDAMDAIEVLSKLLEDAAEDATVNLLLKLVDELAEELRAQSLRIKALESPAHPLDPYMFPGLNPP